MTEKATKSPMILNLDDVIRIFRINDPQYFKDPPEEHLNAHLSNTFLVLEEFNSAALKGFKKFKPKNSAVKYFASKSGGIMTVMMDFRKGAGGKMTDFITITIIQTEDKGATHPDPEKRYTPEPIFSLTGYLVNETDMVVTEAIARTSNRQDMYDVIDATCQADLKAMMIYADVCFSAMLQNKIIDPKAMAPLLSDAQIAMAKERYDLLRDRTKFDIHLMLDGKPPENYRFAVTEEEWINVFQLDNPNIYQQIMPEDTEDIHQDILEFLKKTGSQYAVHFEEGVQFTDLPIFLENGYGDTLWSVSYLIEDCFGIGREHHLLMIAEKDEKKSQGAKKPVVKPLVVLVGEIDHSREEYEPLEAICRVKNNDPQRPFDGMLPLTTPEGFLGAICYAEAAMGNLILQQKLDAGYLTQWLRAPYVPIAEQRYAYLLRRSAERLTLELCEDNGRQIFPEIQSKPEADALPEGYHLN